MAIRRLTVNVGPEPAARPWRSVVRGAAGLVLAAFVVLIGPSIASAHGGGGDDATNYRTTVIDAGDPGLSWRVYGGDALLELTNRTGAVVTVIGYQEEPYLRFGPDGVFENRRSPTTYLNETRYATGEVPAEADPDAAPQWRKVADGDRFAWHDHRAHWMAPTAPPMVEAEPGRPHRVLNWTVPVEIGASDAVETVAAAGRLEWIPGVAVWPWMLGVAVFFLAVLVGPVFLTLPASDSWPGVARTAVALVWLVVAANVVRTVDDLRSVPATGAEQAVVIIAAVLALGSIVGLTVLGWRGTARGMMAVGSAGLLMVLFFGAESTGQLSASQIATTMPLWLRRSTVAASWMIIIPAFLTAGLGAVIHSRHLRRTNPTVAPEAA